MTADGWQIESPHEEPCGLSIPLRFCGIANSPIKVYRQDSLERKAFEAGRAVRCAFWAATVLCWAYNQFSDKAVIAAAHPVVAVLDLGKCVDNGAIVVGVEVHRVLVHHPRV